MEETLKYQAYYTKSDPILNYMTTIMHFGPQDEILEPCGGDGAFVDKILSLSPKANINIYELNPNAANLLKIKYKDNNNIHITETDTLLDPLITSCYQKFDKIIGNPPYGARNDYKKKDLLNCLYKGLYTKESYTLFLYACTRCLKENGELSFIIPDTFLSLHMHLSLRKYLLTNTLIKELTLFPSSFFPGINFGYANLCIITLIKSSDTQKNLENRISIRTNFKSVEELDKAGTGSIKTVSQKSVLESVGSAFMFNSTDILTSLINDESIHRIGDIASCVTGFYSGNDKRYLHPLDNAVKNAKKYVCVETENINYSELTQEEKENGISGHCCFVPIVKGGNTEYIKPDHWFIDWSKEAVSEYKSSKKSRFQNSSFYFRRGIGIPMIRSTRLTGALINNRLFDQSIVGVFPNEEKWIIYLLGFFNSAICTALIEAINPSTNNSANYIKKIPFIVPDTNTISSVERCVYVILSSLEKGTEDISQQMSRLNSIFFDLYYHKKGIDTKLKPKETLKQLNLFDLFDQYADEPENSIETD